MVFEHITTAEAVAYVESEGSNLAGNHHSPSSSAKPERSGCGRHAPPPLLLARGQARGPPPRPFAAAATSGNPKFFLGTDSAPHLISDKESACGCAGIFSAPVALESYATTFEEDGALDRLEALPANSDRASTAFP